MDYLSRRGMGGDAYLSLGGPDQGSEELFMHNNPAISEELVEDQSPHHMMLDHPHLRGRQKGITPHGDISWGGFGRSALTIF